MSAEYQPGRVVGAYRVLRQIGRGGSGTVYEVEHVQLGVRYAMKTFTYASSKNLELLREKFLEEGKLLARLRHPNITRVFDMAIDEQSQTMYFVMDLVIYTDGEPYTVDDVDLESLDEDLVCFWFKDLCAALDYVHAAGIVHRDIKAGNLLIRADKHVVLTDFGVSKIFGGELRDRVTGVSSADAASLIFGTEHYIAPEVVRGAEATPAADAYAVGVLLVRLLTGSWYDVDPAALGRIPRGRYRWAAVVPLLLSPDPARRPSALSDLVSQLAVPAQTERRTASRKNALHLPQRGAKRPAAKPKPKKVLHGMHAPAAVEDSEGVSWLKPLVWILLAVGFVVGGIYFVREAMKVVDKAHAETHQAGKGK